jgi:hypothetical protein
MLSATGCLLLFLPSDSLACAFQKTIASQYASAGLFFPLGPLGILAAPLFEQALDNSQQFCLGWGFTLGKEPVDIELRLPIV